MQRREDAAFFDGGEVERAGAADEPNYTLASEKKVLGSAIIYRKIEPIALFSSQRKIRLNCQIGRFNIKNADSGNHPNIREKEAFRCF